MKVEKAKMEEECWYIVKKTLADKNHYLPLQLTLNKLFGESQFYNPYKTKYNS